MRKFLNAPDMYVDEALEGMCAAYPMRFSLTGQGNRVVTHAKPRAGKKVGIVTGGGAGHFPLFAGYVGEGLVDACAVGDVFSSPNSRQMLDAIRIANTEAGVLLLFGNYGGDRMNFSLAAEAAAADGIVTRTVIVADDVASAARGESEKRRGVAGLVFGYKIAGAMAQTGASLDSVAEVVSRATKNCRTMGVALGPCTVPRVGVATFTMDAGMMELGMGIHGEPGVTREPLQKADEVCKSILSALLDDMPLQKGDRVAVMINSLGATPLEELYICYRYVSSYLADAGIEVSAPWIGRYATSMEMIGLSVTLLKLDQDIEQLLLAKSDSLLCAGE